MVFWQRKARVVRVRQHNDAVSIEHDLPDELLLTILGHLQTQDLLNLRLAHRIFTGPASDEVRNRLRILYIHPSISSLRQAATICDDSFFSQGIEEAALLGSFPSPDMVKVNHERGYTDMVNAFSPWPLYWPQSKGSSQEKYSIRTETKLAEMLSSLPKLNSLAFRCDTSRPGLNQVHTSTIETFAKRRMQLSFDKLVHSKSDIDMLLHLLRSRPFNALKINSPMPFLSNFTPETSGPPSLSHAASLLHTLEIDVHAKAWNITPRGSEHWTSYCRELLRLSASTLRSLKIHISGVNTYQRLSAVGGDTSLYILNLCSPDLHFPNLKTLELRRVPDPKHASRPQRPSMQLLDDVEARDSLPTANMSDFIHRHASTLSQLTISNVLFASSALSPDTEQAPASIYNILKAARRLKSFSYFVSAFRHHIECKKADRPTFELCGRYDCGGYFNAGRFIGLGDLEGVAERLGLQEDEGRQGWEFAEGVGRVD